jgi:beta-lactamase regulating signal transducer with metallopeptidase domain
MSSFLALRFLLTVGDLFAASALIMALAWLAPFRKTASLRHLAWVAAFGALLLLPLLLAIVPSEFNLALAAPAVSVPQMVAAQTIDVPAVAAALPQPESFHFDVAMFMRALIVVWFLGVAVIAIRGAVAIFGLDRLRRNSVSHIFRELPKIAEGHDIRIAPDECGPVTWGFLRPVILLPKSADFWPTERVTAVLLHEMAHISRRDSLTQMLSLLVCALYWPNPFVWIGARAMRREAEIAADDAVIVSGVRPSHYAAELIHLAAQFRAQRPALLNVPMAERAALEARVESILAQNQQRTGVTSMDVLKITTAGFAAAAALAFARPSLAQDAPQPPAPPAMAAPAAPPVPATPAAPPAPVTQADLPTPPAPSTAGAGDHHHHAHIHIVRTFQDRGGHSHVQTIDRDVDPHHMMMDVDPNIEDAMQEVHAHMKGMHDMEAMHAHMAAMHEMMAEHPHIEAQVHEAFAQARAELAKVDDRKIRVKVEAALSRAEEQLARAHAEMEHSHVRIEMDGGDHGKMHDMPPPPPPPAQ